MNSVALSEAKRSLIQKYLQGKAPAIARTATVNFDPAHASIAPLSPTQEGIWRNAQRSGVPPFYNESITIHRNGPMDPQILEKSILEILRRHAAWRTTFQWLNGTLVQVVHEPPSSFPIHLVDISDVAPEQRDEAARRAAQPDVERPYDLAVGPLVRATLVRLGNERYRLHLAVHQIVIDGVTAYHVFFPELVSIYEAFSNGKSSLLPDVSASYIKLSSDQRTSFEQQSQAKLAFWRTALAGELPVLQWPNDRPRPPQRTFRGTLQPFTVSSELSEALNDLSQQQGVTLFTTLLAGFFAILHCYTRQEDIVIGTVAPAGRKQPGASQVLGYFLNPLPLRVDLSGNPTISELLRRVQRVVLTALSNDEVPFETLVEVLQADTDPSRNPFFQLAASLEPAVPQLGPSWDLTPMDIANGGGRWDIYLVWDRRPSGMIGRVQYNPDLFEPSAILRLLEHQQQVLTQFISNPNRLLSQISLVN